MGAVVVEGEAADALPAYSEPDIMEAIAVDDEKEVEVATRITPEMYHDPNHGPRPDQFKAFGWFISKGWKDKWPLQYSAMKGDVIEIIRLVTEAGVPVNVKMTDWYDSEPVGWAASFGQLGALRLLVDLGAYPMTMNKAKNNALTDAKRERHVACVQFLEQYVRDHPTPPPSTALTPPPSTAPSAPPSSALWSDSERSAKRSTLLDRSQYPNGGSRCDQCCGYVCCTIVCCATGNACWYPLQFASMWGCTGYIECLVNVLGCDPNSKNPCWFNSEPLGWAASFGHLHTVQTLIKCGADPSRPPNGAGETPRSDAVRERHTHIVEFLDEWETVAPPKPVQMDRSMALSDLGRDDILDVNNLKNGGPRCDQVCCGYPCCIAVCCATGNAFMCPLQFYSMLGWNNCIKCWIKLGCDPNGKNPWWFGSEPLGWAASFGHLHTVQTLIKCGADPSRPPNGAGETPRSDAVRERHTHIVEFLDRWDEVKGVEGGGNSMVP